MSLREWIVLKPDRAAVDMFEASGFSGILSRLLVNRGIENLTEAKIFLCEGHQLFDPWSLKGMEAAVSRIKKL